MAFVSFVLATATVDGSTVARFVGGLDAAAVAGAWTDPVFGRAGVYFFDLPLYNMLITFIAALAFVAAVTYYLAARGWQLRRELPGFKLGQEIDFRDLRVLGKLETGVLKGLIRLYFCSSPGRDSGWAATK